MKKVHTTIATCFAFRIEALTKKLKKENKNKKKTKNKNARTKLIFDVRPAFKLQMIQTK